MTTQFINLSEYLLQQAVLEETQSKNRRDRSAVLWAKGAHQLSQHFNEQADFFAAKSEELFGRALNYERTATFLATPSEAVKHLAVKELLPDYATA